MTVVQHVGHGLGLAHFGESGGDRDRQRTPEGDELLQGRTTAGDDFDEIIVGQYRRQRDDAAGDLDLVVGKPEHDAARRVADSGQSFGELRGAPLVTGPRAARPAPASAA